MELTHFNPEGRAQMVDVSGKEATFRVARAAATVRMAAATAEKIRAEGEAEYMRILSNAYNDESKADYYNYIRSLDALKASLKGSNKTVILNENSELARILQGN